MTPNGHPRGVFRGSTEPCYPAFLPGLEGDSSFVFADTLGFHAVGMVPDSDKEPKAALAILARALGESETADTVPTVGKQSATILGNEIIKYMECHNTSRLLHIHALRPGDGLTVARSLGRVHEQLRKNTDDDDLDDPHRRSGPAFVLELYPSEGQRGIAGRFIAEAREKRRSGAGVLAADDQWMLESLSLPGGVNLPRLRWARKSEPDPKSAAHLAVAFDTFESRVVPESRAQTHPDQDRFTPLACSQILTGIIRVCRHLSGAVRFFLQAMARNIPPIAHTLIA